MLPHDLHCPTNIYNPLEVGVCDRCYRKFYLHELHWQWDYRGGVSPVNLRIRVCPDDLDQPNPQLQPIIIRGPEGVVRDPRPPQYDANAQGGVNVPPVPPPGSFILDHSILGDEDVL